MKKKWNIFLCLLFTAVVTSVVSFVFLHSLNWVNHIRDHFIWIILLLPMAGLGITWFYQKYCPVSSRGIFLIREQSLQLAASQKIPTRMLPLVFISTLATHLFGGSAGREGVGFQIGAVISDFFKVRFHILEEDRSLVLVSALAGGFASIFGTPWAAAIFAVELFAPKNMRWKILFPAILTAFLSSQLVHVYGYQHTHLSMGDQLPWDLKLVIMVMIMGLIFSIMARAYIRLLSFFEKVFQAVLNNDYKKIFWGSIILVFLVLSFDLSQFIGLGLNQIEASFQTIAMPTDFFWKMVLTALTLSAGFKGGEVTPLFFMGSHLGNGLALTFHLPLSFGAGLGYVGLFAAATRAPIASTVLGCELFGWKFLPFFALSHVVGHYTMGKLSVYKK